MKLKKEVAPTATLGIIIADISAKMDSKVMIKPAVINCDNGSAFISQHFREFLADRQIQLRFSPPYILRLSSTARLSRCGAPPSVGFGTARVLLAAQKSESYTV